MGKKRLEGKTALITGAAQGESSSSSNNELSLIPLGAFVKLMKREGCVNTHAHGD